jgi:hypothetical protein
MPCGYGVSAPANGLVSLVHFVLKLQKSLQMTKYPDLEHMVQMYMFRWHFYFANLLSIMFAGMAPPIQIPDDLRSATVIYWRGYECTISNLLCPFHDQPSTYSIT